MMLKSYPFISIILPIRNEAAYIHETLGAVLAQDYPHEYIEVLIADGMSTDATRRVIGNIGENTNVRLSILDNPGCIVSTGMNVALRQATGQIVVRVDGHCIIASDYVRRCVEHIQNDSVDGVGGPMNTVGEGFLAQAIAMAMSSIFGVGGTAFRTTAGKTMLVDTVPFPAYTRDIIEKAGFYDEELVRNQDDEYNYRLRKLGAKILLAADITSTYYSRASLKALWRQYYQYGFWKVRVLQKHPRQMSLRQFVPPLFVSALIVSALLAFFPDTRLLSLVTPCLYMLINLAASAWAASRQGWKYLPLLPVVYAILHLSYGLGFLFGLVKFANRWGDRQGKVPQF
ncbi:MAG: glycosyltransferase family 2 protein [Chloroflexota bacterium]